MAKPTSARYPSYYSEWKVDGFVNDPVPKITTYLSFD